jgi:hypothetical protein
MPVMELLHLYLYLNFETGTTQNVNLLLNWMFQINLHWEIYESMKLSHIPLVLQDTRYVCMFIYLLRVRRI